MIKIKEVIVVEGIHDEIAVKRGVDAQIIYVSGFGITPSTIKLIKKAQETCGVILLLDPDFAGENIRNIISKKVEGVKHAYIAKSKSLKNGDIGVENAKPEDIVEAIKNAKPTLNYKREEFMMADLIKYRLINFSDSTIRREKLGEVLGIGYANGKKFLSRLNCFNISRKKFEEEASKI